MKANKIQKIEIRNIWGKYNFRWENLNPDVNILTGINGSGKTTFFNIIDALLSADIKRLKLYNIEAEVTIDDTLISFRKDSTLASVKQKFPQRITFGVTSAGNSCYLLVLEIFHFI